MEVAVLIDPSPKKTKRAVLVSKLLEEIRLGIKNALKLREEKVSSL